MYWTLGLLALLKYPFRRLVVFRQNYFVFLDPGKVSILRKIGADFILYKLL